jgi:predicted CopG family antitoxin
VSYTRLRKLQFIVDGCQTPVIFGVSDTQAKPDFMKTITITLDDAIAERLRERAECQGGRSISSLIREACTEKLDREAAAEFQTQNEEVA